MTTATWLANTTGKSEAAVAALTLRAAQSAASVKVSVVAAAVSLLQADDGANTLALRNGVNGQVFNLYRTFTDASNYERLEVHFTSDKAEIKTASAGTGSPRNLSVSGASGLRLGSNGADRWQIDSGHLMTLSDNVYDIGASGATRPRTGYFADNIVTGATDFMHETSVALADGAGVGSGTLSNAPAAGNPTKWIAINDNGTTRHIPAW